MISSSWEPPVPGWLPSPRMRSSGDAWSRKTFPRSSNISSAVLKKTEGMAASFALENLATDRPAPQVLLTEVQTQKVPPEVTVPEVPVPEALVLEAPVPESPGLGRMNMLFSLPRGVQLTGMAVDPSG